MNSPPRYLWRHSEKSRIDWNGHHRKKVHHLCLQKIENKVHQSQKCHLQLHGQWDPQNWRNRQTGREFRVGSPCRKPGIIESIDYFQPTTPHNRRKPLIITSLELPTTHVLPRIRLLHEPLLHLGSWMIFFIFKLVLSKLLTFPQNYKYPLKAVLLRKKFCQDYQPFRPILAHIYLLFWSSLESHLLFSYFFPTYQPSEERTPVNVCALEFKWKNARKISKESPRNLMFVWRKISKL